MCVYYKPVLCLFASFGLCVCHFNRYLVTVSKLYYIVLYFGFWALAMGSIEKKDVFPTFFECSTISRMKIKLISFAFWVFQHNYQTLYFSTFVGAWSDPITWLLTQCILGDVNKTSISVCLVDYTIPTVYTHFFVNKGTQGKWKLLTELLVFQKTFQLQKYLITEYIWLKEL